MIQVPFDPHAGTLSVVQFAELALVLAGLMLMFRATKFATRLVLLGLFLAAVAGLLPSWTR
jgi:hypothetical protein